MLTVYNQGTAYVIRPAPLVSISYTPNRVKNGLLGGSYEITINGTIIADEGSPLYSSGNNYNNPSGPSGFANNYVRPASEIVPHDGELGVDDTLNRLTSILHKQALIRELFSRDGQKIEISPFNQPAVVCYPKVMSVNFEEGIYVDICKYSITLQCDALYDNAGRILQEGLIRLNGNQHAPLGIAGSSFPLEPSRLTDDQLRTKYGGLVEDYSDEWSLEVDEGNASIVNDSPLVDPALAIVPRSYRITRNVSATGKSRYYPSGDPQTPLGQTVFVEGWKEAKAFLYSTILGSGAGYPNYTIENNNFVFSKDILNLASYYRGYNHVRTENFNRAAGTYSVTDTWLLSSGTCYENYNLSLKSDISSPYVTVSIDGTIKGLSTISASSVYYGGIDPIGGLSAFQNARLRYLQISNSGLHGVTSQIYRRANNYIAQTLNGQPKSISLGLNEITGEITYALEFDNRPNNVISGVLSESINVNDTYPGDVFAVIPVIGRQTGPILQYIGGRTEYKRDVTIEIVVDYTDIPYGSGRNPLILAKPILHEPIKSQISNLIIQLSPALEPGIRKYFLSPPSESWNPKDGRYSLSLSWTYELDH